MLGRVVGRSSCNQAHGAVRVGAVRLLSPIGAGRFLSGGNCRRWLSSAAPTPPRELNQVVKLETMRFETPDRISQLWIDYHVKKPSCVSAVAPAHTYALLNRRLAESPLFVLPLPRETGFVSVLLEAHADQDEVVFTELERYQQASDKRVVPSSLHLRYYTDLAQTKNLVLVRGEVDLSRLSTTDAQYLVNQLQIYYLADGKYAAVKTFNHDPAHFDYDAVLGDLRGAAVGDDSTPR